MTQKKIYLISAITISTLVAGFYFSGNEEPTVVIKPKANVLKQHKSTVFTEQNNLNATQEITGQLQPTLDKVVAPKKIQSVTPTLDNTEDFLGISRRSDIAEKFLTDAGVIPADLDKAEFIEFDLSAISQLKTGESFDLEIPQTNEIFTAEVTQVEVFANGDKHIIGNIVGLDDSLHNTIITVGKDALYGQFTTVSGNWVFESKDQYGWIAAKRDLYRSHVEFDAVELTPSEPTTHGVKDIFAPKKQ